jgi:hypothetical protein
MTHLAQFSSLSKQGELLCTQGLAYLLQTPDACAAVGTLISKRVGKTLAPDLTWHAEPPQQDGGRPDLEARTADGKPVAKIEAKLGAALSDGQVRSYVTDLQNHCDGGLLLILVPRHRVGEITASVSKAFALNGDSPWVLSDISHCVVAVIDWEEVLDVLDSVRCEPYSGDLAQFKAMYRVLKGYDIEPITSDAELLRWREKEDVFVSLVDRVTRYLAQDCRVLPMGFEEVNSYHRRYVCPPLGGENPCFSVGARDPFDGHKTPIWMRFNCTTPKFPVIHERLFASNLSKRLLESGGHIWIPLDVPLDTGGEGLVTSLVTQAKEIIQVAYQPLD